MNELINHWFEQSSPFEGILACGMRYSDQSICSKTWSDAFGETAMENALRCVADFFQVLQLNRIPPSRIRWVYQGALLHCERRQDGTCMGVFTSKDPGAVDNDGLDRFFSDFQAVAKPATP